jgi:hypothetical protein
MSNLVSNMFNPNAGASAPGGASAAPEVESPNASIPGMPPMGGGFDNIFQS